MSQSPGSFRPGELADAEGVASEADLIAASTVARELERALPMESIAPSAGFADRVMAAVAREPAPRPLGFLAGLRAHPGPSAFVASVRDAWRLATGGVGRPGGARGLALAYVLAVVLVGTSLTGFAAYGWAGALGFLDGDSTPSPTPSVVMPSPSPVPSVTPTPEASPSVPAPSSSMEPSESEDPGPSMSPEPSDDDGGAATSEPGSTSVPTATPGATSPAASDDNGGSTDAPSPSAEDSSSPKPSDTPRPSDTPKPSQTPN